MALETRLKKTFIFIFVAIFHISACKKDNEQLQLPLEKLANRGLHTKKLMSLEPDDNLLNAGSILKLGINGHLGDAPYLNVPCAIQIEMLKERGFSYYRINVQTKDDGTASSSMRLKSLQIAADAANIKLLPMLYLRKLDYNKSEEYNYDCGKQIGSRFAALYGKYFEFYNLGNDEELPIIYKNKTGIKPEHYDPVKFKATAAFLKGMDEGIKENDMNAKTMIGAGWLHFGFLQMCEDYGIKFDRIAYNWYSDMENAAARAPYFITDITQTLTNLFPDKPIWFAEYNYRYKATSNTNEIDQDEFVKRFTAKCSANPNVKVAIIYQLFDEPYKSTHEATYGIIKWKTQYSVWEDKALSKTFILHSYHKLKNK